MGLYLFAAVDMTLTISPPPIRHMRYGPIRQYDEARQAAFHGGMNIAGGIISPPRHKRPARSNLRPTGRLLESPPCQRHDRPSFDRPPSPKHDASGLDSVFPDLPPASVLRPRLRPSHAQGEFRPGSCRGPRNTPSLSQSCWPIIHPSTPRAVALKITQVEIHVGDGDGAQHDGFNFHGPPPLLVS